jgi:hypothetical protein
MQLEIRVDNHQLNDEQINLVSATPLMGHRRLPLEPASPLLPVGGMRDATPMLRVNMRANNEGQQINIGGITMMRPGAAGYG